MALSQEQHTLRGNSVVVAQMSQQFCFGVAIAGTGWESPAEYLPLEAHGTCPPFVSVFVFTLDCNNHIYCYDTEDVTLNSRLADKP
jgi:hypothetical protein